MSKYGIVGKKYWTKYFEKCTIVDCAVQSKNIIYVASRPNIDPHEASMAWDSENPTNMCALLLDREEGNNFAVWQLDGMNKPKLGVSIFPGSHGLLVSQAPTGEVVVMGKNVDEDEVIDPDGAPLTVKVKTVLGYAYSVGADRQLYKRVAAGAWEAVEGIPEVEDEDVASIGFRDLDAFSEADMYAVGGKGDIWHFDGSTWQQKGFPSNVTLATVTCAGDGNVYITGEGGSIWMGRESTWKLVYSERSSVLWNDAIWFANQLWLSSDYEFGVWDGTTVKVPRAADGSEILMSGHMDARDGLLAIASPTRVLTFDGANWRVVVARPN